LHKNWQNVLNYVAILLIHMVYFNSWILYYLVSSPNVVVCHKALSIHLLVCKYFLMSECLMV
jgi:hypothetical protein